MWWNSLFSSDMLEGRDIGEVQIAQIGNEVAKFFVSYCDTEHSISLRQQFRRAKTRQMLIEAIDGFVYLGESIKVQQKQLQISPTKWETLTRFVEKGKITDVRKLHTSMMLRIAMLEIDKIQRMEQYLNLLNGIQK
jgi:hypothetical protein